MINNEWERSLDELNRTIQDAIDHQKLRTVKSECDGYDRTCDGRTLQRTKKRNPLRK